MRTIEELKIEELNKRKVPVVVIDECLDKYDSIELFPKKLAKANKMLQKSDLPNDLIKNSL